MNNRTPSPDRNPWPRRPWKRLFRLSWTSLGIVVFVGATGAGWRLLNFVQHDLAPTVEADLNKRLNRPLRLGAVKSFSWDRIQFDQSELPAYRTQIGGRVVRDADHATVESVDVRFNPLTALTQRTLNLDITLNQPRLYLDESPDGQWLNLQLEKPKGKSAIKTEIQSVTLKNGTATLKPNKIEARHLERVDGTLDFVDGGELISIQGRAEVDSGGTVNVRGQWLQQKQSLSLQSQSRELAIAPLIGFLPTLPFAASAGTLNGRVDVRHQLNQPLQVDMNATLRQVDAYVPEQDVALNVDRIKGNLTFRVDPNKPVQIKGNADIFQAKGSVPEDLILETGRSRRQNAFDINGSVKFLGVNQRFWSNLKAQLPDGGTLKVKGVTSFLESRSNLVLQGQGISAALFDQAFNLPIQVTTGRVNGNIKLKLNKGDRPYLQGIAQLRQVKAQVTGLPQPFNKTNGSLSFQGLTATLDNVRAEYGDIPLIGNGSIGPDSGYNLTASTEILDVNQALKTLGVTSLPFPVSGQARANRIRVTGKIETPLLTGEVNTIGTATFDQVPFDAASARFNLSLPILSITDIKAQPSIGGSINGQARYDLRPNRPWTANLSATNVPGNALAKLYSTETGFALGPLQSQAALIVRNDRYDLDVDFQALQGEFPTVGKLKAIPGEVRVKDVITQIPGGDLNINGTIANNQVNLIAALPGLDLTAYSEDLRGQLEGRLSILGPLSNFSPTSASAQGTVQLTQGISLIEDPIGAQIRWNGQHIVVDQATAPGFKAQGILGAELEGPNSPALTTLDLAIEQREYDLAQLPFELPANTHLKGLADLKGKLSGQVDSPQLASNIWVKNLWVNDLDFEPRLQGKLGYGLDTGLKIKAAGPRDRVNLTLSANQEPTEFWVKNREAMALGRTVAPNQLAVDVKNVPLTALNWDVVNEYGYGRVTGNASGAFQVSLPTYNISGPLRVNRPAVGPFRGDQLNGNFQLTNGVIALTQAELTRDQNRFLIDAQLIPDTNPKFSGDVTIAQAEVQDTIAVLETLNFLEPMPGKQPQYGHARDVETVPVGESDAPILIQLQRLAEIKRLLQTEAELAAQMTVPGFRDLAGQFQGKVQLKGTAQTGVRASFNLESEQINWAEYPITNIVANGSFLGDSLTFSNLSLQPGEGQVAFTGNISPQRQSGRLTVANLSLEEIGDRLSIPMSLSGRLDGEATLGGTLGNPSLLGQLQLTNAILDQTKLQQAQAQFEYQQARLNFEGEVDLETPDPVKFSGSIPYRFPFMNTTAKTNNLALEMQVRNHGLSLMNLFTDQIEWVDGQGDLNIAIDGTPEQPQVQGTVELENATFASLSLPEPLTNVTGKLRFDQTHVQVENLSGDFSEGKLKAVGTLPLFSQALTSSKSSSEQMQVQLTDLAMNIKGLYKGEVRGLLNVTGSLFEPNIGGTVALNQGQVVLSDATAISSGTSTEPLTQQDSPIQFNQLKVQLEDNVRILQPPLLNFVTQGELEVNGSIDTPRPEGVVVFKEGEVNLFTSIFRLNPRKDSYAAFNPSFGLDPYLNVNLSSSLTEVTNGRQNALNEFDDPLASALGSIESVRVNATIDGRASQLLNNFEQAVELTSNPNRSRGEILALLSGGVPEALQEGDAELALANIASSAFLNQVQSLVDDSLGGRAVFRLFPVLIPNDTEGSVLAFGGELGYDITDDLSVSVLQILRGTEDPTRFNLSYDINERLRARGTVSIEGEAAGVLEYRFRF